MDEKANTVKTLIILFIAGVWSLALLKEKAKQQTKCIERELVLGTLIDSLQDVNATKDSLIVRWETHHIRIKEYAIEWDSKHTR